MLDKSILDNNLNEVVSYKDFFKAFGFTDNDKIYLRSFDDKKGDDKGHNMDILLCVFDHILSTLKARNDKGEGIFFIPNGDGQLDKLVKHARAQYIDIDDYSFLQQIEMLNEFKLEPSIIVKAKKSLHAYWLLQDGDIRYFREIQERLIQHFGSDVRIKNESRVMRLYGFNHNKTDPPTLVKLIKFNPELRYTQQQLHEVLPRLKNTSKKKSGRSAKSPSDQDGKKLIVHGERHGYLIERLGYYVQTIGDTSDDEMIFALLWADFQQNCENDDHLDYEHIRSHYFNEIEKTRAKFAENKKDPGFFKYARKAWMNEHPGEEFDPDKVGWSEIEAAGHRAKEKNLLFDWRPAKPSDPSEYGDTSEMSETQALELSRKEASALNLVKVGKDDNVHILSIPENYYTILRDDPYLRGKLRYNMLDGRVYAHGFFWGIDDHPVRDVDLFNIRRFESSVYRIHSKEDILDNIYAVADFNAFHPVREMLNSLEWDGAERIPDLLPRYLGAEKTDYTTAVTKLLLYAVIQRVFHPGIKFDTAIILADTKQGTGKSTLCRLLALRDEWYTDSLDDLNDNKRAFEALRGHIIVELGEMIATRRARDIETIKGYLSRTADDYRTPHAKFTERYPRQAVFIGTSNRSQFLPDDRSGNRRFIPVLCDGNRQEVHPMANIEEAREYVRQCYAEAMVIGEQEGFPLVLSKEHEDRLKRLQEISAPEDEKVGIIQEWLDSAKPSFVCTRMIYDYALPNTVFCNHMRGNAPEKWELQEIAEIMITSIEGYVKYMGTDGSKMGAKKYFSAPGRDYGYQRAWMRVEDIPSDIPSDIPTDTYPDEKHIPSKGDLDGFTKVKDDEDIPL